ncbi:MAG: macrolide ABC transporter ATP-binding protein [Candidatus Nealsonbacteria bacterium CG23_combo_of_CG06-09_8_20_14_all_38_19]|uniref:Macrolide ABC transporter ATP-binding protein n=1 Tax=Candidatus Nealsonbacteria bacterium CG23_combo_of_CG06-09_8_20_14_all_38_19 TaxID=1974721 RepID=A0A2G9YWP8_9BACT|nr:MAG: macrolide ABC transporter ATP-binding protein [Candidatus Nealsonbacteria bacterium CG23_combo_of_CG06-09_8_20_14_all_38_19]
METPVLHGVSFNIEPGEFVAIMGPSGSGKSTLMHIMGFLDRPTGGIYKFEGKSIDEFNDDDLARIRNKKMGFVFQTYNLLPRTTVFDNVRLPLVYSGLEDKMEKDLVKEAIAAVGLSHRINFYSNQLSGGEQQRVAIARALVNNPSVIFADEPTGNLDSRSGKVVMLLLQELNDEGHTIVLVTHEKYTSEHAKRIIQLYDGRLVSDEKVSLRRYAKDEKELIK